jgi:pyridoxal phosphate enzyme (YggS family)
MNNSTFAVNLKQVRDRMSAAAARCGRSVDAITLIANSTGFPMDAIRAARRAGLVRFGESLVEEWEDKRADLGGMGAIWHFIGELRSDNAKRVVQLFDRVDSLTSLSLAQRLNEVAAGRSFTLEVLIEVNLSGDALQSGVTRADLPALAEAVVAMPNLELMGLMANAHSFEDDDEARSFFERMIETRDELAEAMDWPLRVLSMGTSRDFEIAIEEGATEIRLGKALFGERKI